MNGSGSAYGLYLHPDAIQNGVAPWAFWEHEDDSVYFLADDSAAFFRGYVDNVASRSVEADRLARIRSALDELGVPPDAPPMDLFPDSTGPNRPWLPPAQDDLLSTTEYVALLATDLGAAERGLLGRWQYERDGEAGRALDDYYAQRGLTPPRSYQPEFE